MITLMTRHSEESTSAVRLRPAAALGLLLSLTLVSCAEGTEAATDSTADPAGGDDRLRIAVATNEPWGAYHVEHVAEEVAQRGGEIQLIVPDLSEVDEEASVESVPLDEANPDDYDLLVVNGAEEWPVEVAEEFQELPIVASSTAYLRPEEAEHAERLRPRLAGITASSPAERETFAVYFGVPEEDIDVVGVPELDDTPDWSPEPETVLILTSVTHPDETGGAAPGTELLLEAAHALDEEGYDILVGLHPREDESLWNDFDIAQEGSVEASVRASRAVGIPGTVFPRIAAVGTPLVAVMDSELEVPEYLLSTAETAETVDEVLAAVDGAQPLSQEALDYVVGPLGAAAEQLVDAWEHAAAVDPGELDHD